MFSFQYRLGLIGNLFGEKVSSEHLKATCEKLSELMGSHVLDATFSTSTDGYILWAEVHDENVRYVTENQGVCVWRV